MSNFQISVNRHTIAHILATLIALLLAASLLGQISRYVFGHDHVFGLVRCSTWTANAMCRPFSP